MKIERLTYLEQVNKTNIEKQDQRNVDNLKLFKKLGDDMKAIKAMQSEYGLIKIDAIIADSEAFLAEYGVGGTIDMSA